MTTESREGPYVHSTALVEENVTIGLGTRVWHHAHIRESASIGARCIVGKGVYIDFDVVIGDDCKLQNYACVYHGTTLGRGVFVGPHAVLANDLFPRATDPQLRPLRGGDWEVGTICVEEGASIGACACILPNVVIGHWALVGAGAVVISSIPPYALVVGCPARQIGWV